MLGEREDVPRLLRGLDVVVLSSAYGEGTPNIIAEAMATGVPCVTTNVGDAATLVGRSGLVVAPRNPQELSEAIQSLVQESAEARALRGHQAREAIEMWHDLGRATASYRELCGVVPNQNAAEMLEAGVQSVAEIPKAMSA